MNDIGKFHELMVVLGYLGVEESLRRLQRNQLPGNEPQLDHGIKGGEFVSSLPTGNSEIGAMAADLMTTVLNMRDGEACSEIIKFADEAPPNDYEYDCVIVFRDGCETRSDGWTVHDCCVKSGIAYGWRRYLQSANCPHP